MVSVPRTLGEELCIDFANSRYQDHRTGAVDDRLAQVAWQRWFLERGGFEVDGGEPPLEALESARTAIRGALERWAAGGTLPAADAAALDGLVARAPGSRRVLLADDRPHESFAPARRDWTWVAAEVALSAARLIERGQPGRLKRCGNPACTWLFYDQSHNSSRRWCDVATCGNLVKVRQFRARRRATRA